MRGQESFLYISYKNDKTGTLIWCPHSNPKAAVLKRHPWTTTSSNSISGILVRHAHLGPSPHLPVRHSGVPQQGVVKGTLWEPADAGKETATGKLLPARGGPSPQGIDLDLRSHPNRSTLLHTPPSTPRVPFLCLRQAGGPDPTVGVGQATGSSRNMWGNLGRLGGDFDSGFSQAPGMAACWRRGELGWERKLLAKSRRQPCKGPAGASLSCSLGS